MKTNSNKAGSESQKIEKTQDEMGFRFSAKTSFNPAIFYMLHVHNNTINKAQETISENKQESRNSGTKLHKIENYFYEQQATISTPENIKIKNQDALIPFDGFRSVGEI